MHVCKSFGFCLIQIQKFVLWHWRTKPLKRGQKKKNQDVIPIKKMTEKFARNPVVDSEKDIAKRVFYLSDDRIRVEFHKHEDRITNSSRIFHKDGHSHIVQVLVNLTILTSDQ